MGNIYPVLSALIGGAAGALDKIDGATLADGDAAIVILASGVYHYHLNATSGEDESSPDIISPDDNAGDKRWILGSINVKGFPGLLADEQHVLDAEVLAAAGVNSGITSMTGLDDDGIPVAKVADAMDKTAPVLEGDLDGQGNYLVDVQNIPDLASKGEGYFNTPNSNNHIETNSTILNGMDYMSMIIVAQCNSNPASGVTDINLFRNAGGGTGIYANENKTIRFIIVDSVDGKRTPAIPFDFDTDQGWHTWGLTFASDEVGEDGFVRGYKDGKLIGTSDTAGGTIVSGTSLKILGDGDGRSWPGTVARALLFNIKLTATEVKALSSSASLPFKWIENTTDTPGEVRNAGNFVIGAAYRILTRTDGDFVSAGAADNVVGTEFIATATAAGVLDGGDTAIRLGCVLPLEQSGIGHNQWLPTYGDLIGDVSGALPTNLPVNHTEKVIKKTIAVDTLWTDIVPAGYMLELMQFENTTANQSILDAGTSDGDNDIFTGEIIAASAITTVVINKYFSATEATDIDLNDDQGGSSWNSGSFTVTLIMKRMV